MDNIQKQAMAAKAAQRVLAKAESRSKNQALIKLAELLETHQSDIFAANQEDVAFAKQKGLDAPRVNRLTITANILEEMRNGVLHVAEFDDPIGVIEEEWQRPNGLFVGKMRIPLGVICIIYEARPNVTIDAATLCIKAGCAVLLRGGSEASHSNLCLVDLLQKA
ncbi:MAG: aldehyde dehydrogenase family protein, partial [Desulfovibrio sp.]|nr:aldehyde dehydrogenase family protein [Desulfovibrio sp.]